jgi:hypothetical protein
MFIVAMKHLLHIIIIIITRIIMFIKIMTDRNTERLISDVSDVDLHRSSFSIVTDQDLQNTISYGPGVFQATGATPYEVQTYDGRIEDRMTGYGMTCFKFIDYKKNGDWYRLAIACKAYVCNEDGKTISKIEVEPQIVGIKQMGQCTIGRNQSVG